MVTFSVPLISLVMAMGCVSTSRTGGSLWGQSFAATIADSVCLIVFRSGLAICWPVCVPSLMIVNLILVSVGMSAKMRSA